VTTLRLALAQYDFPVGAVAKNAEKIRTLIHSAQNQYKADLVAFPELTLCGYPPEDLLLRPAVLAACESELAKLAHETKDIAAYVGHPHSVGEVYNAASLLCNGRIEVTTHKQALPNYAVFDEKRYFRSGHQSTVVNIRGVQVGLLICEDIWEIEPAAHAVAQGAEILLVINASPFDIGKAESREKLLTRRARENSVAIVYLNLVGGQDDLLFDGASLLVNATGEIGARAPAFMDTLLIADYDATRKCFTPIDWPQESDSSTTSRLYAGLVRATRDYVRKNGFSSILLGLSGGIDSALTLAIATDALGAEHVSAVMMPSRYTSQLSLNLAAEQAKKMNVEYRIISIELPFQAFLSTLKPLFSSNSPDVTEENLQARCRGSLLMAVSNKFGRILLSTSNKSEMAVGYSTLYGDMCGGFAPLKDVYKTQVYELARWRNAKEKIIPDKVITRAPSAELHENQTDQDSLPPYDKLDSILQKFIEGEQSQAEIIAAGFDEIMVRKVIRLVLANEYKRRQSAPGPRVSARAFGRDRRYPISSGWK